MCAIKVDILALPINLEARLVALGLRKWHLLLLPIKRFFIKISVAKFLDGRCGGLD